jgi:16S rRNA processing protein RimM
VGRVRGLHGLDGEVRVEVLTDRPADRFAAGAQLFREGDAVPLTVVAASPVADGPGWWLSFGEVRNRTAAERLRDRFLEVVVDRAADLEAGQAYWHEVIGAEVVDTGGRSLGRVADVYRAGEAEVYLVRGGPLGELDVPAVRGIVVDFAPAEGRIVVDDTALDLDAASEPRPSRPRKAHRWSRHGKGSPGRAAGDAPPDAPDPAP